jgi:hypothetical protein
VSRPHNLRRVHVCLSSHGTVVGEYLWAAALGRDLYELRSIPFRAYGLPYRDVVRATSDRSSDAPEVRFVVRCSGHRTLRVVFADDVPPAVRLEMLGTLEPFGIGFEHAFDGFYLLDVTPEGGLAVVCRQLDGWRAGGLLDYETCETRRAGSYDLPSRSSHRREKRSPVGPCDQRDSGR